MYREVEYHSIKIDDRELNFDERKTDRENWPDEEDEIQAGYFGAFSLFGISFKNCFL